MNKKITIITPTYNRAHTLDRVYQSLIRQSFKDFLWLVMDDGSTDHTKDLIQKFKEERQIEIEYVKKENRKKFCALMDGIFNYTHTLYFIIMDSDDEFYKDSINEMYNQISSIDDDSGIGSIVGNTVDSNGNLVGTEFPKSPLDIHVFEMRHKFKVKGGKMAIHNTKKFKSLNYHTEFYCGKGYVPDDVWQNIFDSHFQSRFVNKIFKIYHLDNKDLESLSSSRYTRKSAFGIKESYRTALINYSNRWLCYPGVMSKKMMGYIYFGLYNKQNIIELYRGLNTYTNKSILLILYIPSFLLKIFKPLSK